MYPWEQWYRFLRCPASCTVVGQYILKARKTAAAFPFLTCWIKGGKFLIKLLLIGILEELLPNPRPYIFCDKISSFL